MQPQGSDLAESLVQDCNSGDTKLHLTKAGEAETKKSKEAAEKLQSLLPLPGRAENALSGLREKDHWGARIRKRLALHQVSPCLSQIKYPLGRLQEMP